MRVKKITEIIAIVVIIGFAMLGCASGPTPEQLSEQRRQQRLELYNSIDYQEIQFGQLRSAIASVTTDGKGFKVTAYVSYPNWHEFYIGNEPVTYGSGSIRLGAGWDFGDSLRARLENDRQYTVYIAVLKESFVGTPSGNYNGIVTRIEGLRSAEEAAGAREEASRQAQIARQEQQQVEQERLANLYRQAGNNVGNLRNTSRSYRLVRNFVQTTTYDFGDGNFIATVTTDGYQGRHWSGTYRVNGDTVIFLSSEGVYSFGTIVGNTLTINGNVYR